MSQIIIVTGASEGLGRSTALEAAKRGYTVAAIARNQDRLRSLREQSSVDGAIHTFACDLTHIDAVSGAFDEISTNLGDIKALINNAGTWTGGKGVSELNAEEIRRSLDLNFFSAFHCISESLKRRKNSKPLHIINVGATASTRGGKNTSAFAIAKSSLRILTQSLAREMGPQGVHAVHVILDGLIDNHRTRGLNPSSQDENYMNPKNLAKSLIDLCEQPKDAWTLEVDFRPYSESF